MKLINVLMVFTSMVILSCCTTTKKFPVSTSVPAANFSLKKNTDNQKNFVLEITAENLASADRLTPPGNNYSVWIVTNENRVKNVGQLVVQNARKSTFKTTTPYDFSEVFITVENSGDLEYPVGIEITRMKL